MSAKAIKLAARYSRKSDVVEIYQDILNEQYHVNAFNFPKYPIVTTLDEVQVFNKRITMEVINKAVSIFILSFTLVIITTIVLLINNEGTFLQTLFEATSAFGTVGLSTGITPNLCNLSKYQLIITMLLGRVGTITAFVAFFSLQAKNNLTYRCPEGRITVG